MKRLLLIFPFSLCLAIPACKKVRGPANEKSVQQNNNLDSTVSMTASINGKPWHSDTAYGYFVDYSGNAGIRNLMITATQRINDTATTSKFNITNYTGPNT